MSDCTGKHDLACDSSSTPGITFADVLGTHKTGKKLTEGTLELAQASCPPGQVCGIPKYGTVAPIGDAVRKEAIKRDNEIHGFTPAPLPVAGTSREEQKRAIEAKEAADRVAETLNRTKKELDQPDPMTVLSAGVDAFEAAGATEVARRALNAGVQRMEWFNPQLGSLQQTFRTMNEQIAEERAALARARKGTPEYARLQERVQTYDKLKLGTAKSKSAQVLADAEMTRLNPGGTAFTDEEVLHFMDLREKEKLLFAEKSEGWARLTGDIPGGALRIARGVGGTAGAYSLDRLMTSNFVTPNSQAANFWIPSDSEMAVVGISSTLPVPKFVPGAGGNLLQRLGARVLEEGVLWAGTKFGVMVQRDSGEPTLERGLVDAAKQAQANDHKEKTPDTMMAATDAWKALSGHMIQIRQAMNVSESQVGTTDPAKLAETRRDLVAILTAYGEAWLDSGTAIGALGKGLKPFSGPDGQAIIVKPHFVFSGTEYDFGGLALKHLNTAKNILTTELGIDSSDHVANRIYASKFSAYEKILGPHEDLPAIFDQLKTMAQTDSPDAKWLSAWLVARVADQKKDLADEEGASIHARDAKHQIVPTFTNYTLAKVYQDQALLEIAYATAGRDPQKHLAAAHDLLKMITGEKGGNVPLGWDGHVYLRNGEPVQRQSDLPQIIEYYKNAGGVVDWERP